MPLEKKRWPTGINFFDRQAGSSGNKGTQIFKGRKVFGGPLLHGAKEAHKFQEDIVEGGMHKFI